MEPQMTRSHEDNQAGQEPQFVGQQQEGGGEEKKSMMTKVKDKAKKIRDTMKKHGHGHDHDGSHESDEMKTPPDNDHDVDEEDEEIEDPAVHSPPEIHGAPMYESGAATTGHPEGLSRPGVTSEHHATGDEEMKSALLGGGEEDSGVDLEKTRNLGELPDTPQNTQVQSSDRHAATFVPGKEEFPEQRKVNLTRPRGVEEDPAAPTGNTESTTNYQSKVADPTGKGEEVRELPTMIESFGKLGMKDEENREEKQGITGDVPLPTGSHDQFNREQSRPEPASSAKPDAEMMDASETQQQKPPNQGGFMSTISGKAAALGTSLMSIGTGRQDREAATTNQSSIAEAVKERIAPVNEKTAGPGSQTNQETREQTEIGGDQKTANYQSKVADPTGKGEEVREIPPMIESFGKLGMKDEENRGEKQGMTGNLPLPTGSHDQFNREQSRPEPASSAEPDVEMMDASETQQQKPPIQGGFMSTISGKAAALGTSLMSIGTGKQDKESATTDQSSVAEAVKEKIAPVNEKAAGPGSQTNQESREPETEIGGDQKADAGSKQFSMVSSVKEKAAGSNDEGETGKDKGVSVSSYLLEKLKPGEEDKALSEVISEKLMKKREETEQEGSSSPGKGGVVDKLKGAVGSWFGKPDQGQPTNGSATRSDEVDQRMGVGKEEKQLQEPGN